MPIIKLLAGMSVMILLGCSRDTDLRDQFQKADYGLPFDQRLRLEAAAPIIVLGTVLEVGDIGRPQRSIGDSRVKTQLTRIKLNIEQVIKGDVVSGAIELYYFTFSKDNDVALGVPRYLPNVGQHRIYFLKPSKGIYRSVGDVTDYTLRVSSGHHGAGFCEGRRPGCCIAELLLAPQQDLDRGSFVRDIMKNEYVAEVLCSRPAALDLMRTLTLYPDKSISEGAREVMAVVQAPPSKQDEGDEGDR